MRKVELREVVEEIAYARVIRVAIDDLSIEILAVMLKFPLDVGKLCIELITLCQPRCTKVAVGSLANHSVFPLGYDIGVRIANNGPRVTPSPPPKPQEP
jgi:hypothetical protein